MMSKIYYMGRFIRFMLIRFVEDRGTHTAGTLAYTTLMALGVLTLFLGQGSEYGMTAFVTFLIVHSLYKASLFLVVGCIDHSTGSREAGVLGGLGRAMPITAFAAALARD